MFEIYWGEDKDISQDAVLTEVCKRVGVDPAKFLEGISQQAIKDQLKANTDEVMTRGGFGSPTIFIDRTDMYFGNDRMPLIREALAAPQRERGLMPRAIVCRELGPPECLRLEQVPQMPLQAGQVRVAIRAAGHQFPRHPDGGRRVSAQAGVAVYARAWRRPATWSKCGDEASGTCGRGPPRHRG